MAKEVWMSLDIVDFGNGIIDCRYCESIDDEPIRHKMLSLNEARQMYWELILAGAAHEISINRLDRSIVRKTAWMFVPLSVGA